MRHYQIFMNVFVPFLAAVISTAAFGQQSSDTSQVAAGNPQLRKELLAMEVTDQKVRTDWINAMSSHAMDSTIVMRMDSIDRANTKRVKEIIKEHGWPGMHIVGKDGAEAAFLIVQHSPDTLFQKSCLPLVQEAFKAGEASGNDVALLTDRVYVREGKRQVYGSQAKIIDGKLVIDPIEDEANVDKRRAELGLPPMAEYITMLEEMYHLKVK
jgi:hypothetical protein